MTFKPLQKNVSKNHLKIFTTTDHVGIEKSGFACCNNKPSFEALGPGPRNPQEASVGHFFHPHVAPYGTTAAPGCPPPGPTTGRDGSPKRSMRSFGPLFNSGYLGSARMSRRRITWFILIHIPEMRFFSCLMKLGGVRFLLGTFRCQKTAP